MGDSKYPAKVQTTYARKYGALLLASMISFCLYGVGLLMVLQYFRRHSTNDPMVLKVTVVVLVILATLQTVFASHQIYNAFITKQGALDLLDEIVVSVPGKYICGYFTAFVAEVFFSSRIWIVGRSMRVQSRYFTVPALALALMQLSAGIAQGTIMRIAGKYSVLSMRTRRLIEMTTIQGVGAALSDIIISATLCYIFHSGRTAVGRTNSMINQLIKYAVNRALATSFCAVLSVLLYYFASGTYYYQIPLLSSTPLYLISAVSMLTTREGLRERGDVSFHITNLAMTTEKTSAEAEESHCDTSAHTTSVPNTEKSEA
ncbi:hypothetical protein CPB83DRAFT_697545 [Crepidotus variabilis]|uniref:DUF6534 domain-containing protein n=1 Tax=Crepidotus variabilis TaxID=179855 RepID=A0A9P6E633_9AGAR|nr:hypothetical protein CPB83DRAFT_697545 [Crepidotus variabilis]